MLGPASSVEDHLLHKIFVLDRPASVTAVHQNFFAQKKCVHVQNRKTYATYARPDFSEIGFCKEPSTKDKKL